MKGKSPDGATENETLFLCPDDISENELNNNNNSGGEFHLGKRGSPVTAGVLDKSPGPAAVPGIFPPPPLPPPVASPTTQSSPEWYGKPEMLPFLSLCSRYSSGPWAGLLQQTIKEKQKLNPGEFKL